MTDHPLGWCWPLPYYVTVPVQDHPGAFGAERKHDVHTGVDLYCRDAEMIRAVEDGQVLAIVDFTGPSAASPWWLPTRAVLVEGASGVVCYGEVRPMPYLKIGDAILRDDRFARVAPVLPVAKVRKDIPGHSRFMLHVELYRHGTLEPVAWELNEKQPIELVDPTLHLINALHQTVIKA